MPDPPLIVPTPPDTGEAWPRPYWFGIILMGIEKAKDARIYGQVLGFLRSIGMLR